MSKKKEAVKRFSARIRADLLANAKKVASERRWSINDVLEEALISFLSDKVS